LRYIVLGRRLRIKDIYESDHSTIKSGTLPYRCLRNGSHREGERELAKQQGKTGATKAQQDLPVNVVINNRLLVCKD
jgi:hypothetical protein